MSIGSRAWDLTCLIARMRAIVRAISFWFHTIIQIILKYLSCRVLADIWFHGSNSWTRDYCLRGQRFFMAHLLLRAGRVLTNRGTLALSVQ